MQERNDKIRVLQVNKLYHPVTGGIERVVQQLAEGLCEDTDTKVLVCRKKGRTIVEQIGNALIAAPVCFVFMEVPQNG